MVANGTTEYYYNFNITNSLGNYIVNGKCDLNGVTTVFAYNLGITPQGLTTNIGFFIFLTIVILAILLIGVFTHNLEITLIGGLISSAWGIYTAFYGFDTIKNAGTEIFSIGIIAVSLYWIAIAGIDYLGG